MNVTIASAQLSKLANVVLLTSIGADTTASASHAIGTMDTALNNVATMRASLGNSMNSLESAMALNDVISTGFQTARSGRVDVDIASEVANMTKNMILQQAGTSVLAQANMQPQMMLQLLKNI
jgi:flagellin